MSKPNDDLEDSAPCPKDWLDHALEAARESRFLHQRAQMGGRAAWIIAKLRDQHQLIGFKPLSLASYLALLAQGAGITDLTPLLSWYRIADLSDIGKQAACAIARVCRLLGLPWDNLRAHVALSLNQGEPVAVENWNTEVEHTYPAVVVNDLRHHWRRDRKHLFNEIEALMAAEYEE